MWDGAAYQKCKRSAIGYYQRSSSILVFFSTTIFPVMLLGKRWWQKFGVPYVLDFQDPWRSDYHRNHPDKVQAQ
ncbi:MAG: hypothetical protein HC849_32625, partial [Oscillatoriales cyanobacterium RU_3_3]|nr:hypothetical protein [Oscillatoriales cyanobacterium RU_3_3]